MIRKLVAAAYLTAASTSALAIEAEAGRDLLPGTWTSNFGGETWIFDADGNWQQYVGGAHFESTYEVETMPSIMLRLTSEASGNAYIFHFRSEDTIEVYPEGETEIMGSFRRQPDAAEKSD